MLQVLPVNTTMVLNDKKINKNKIKQRNETFELHVHIIPTTFNSYGPISKNPTAIVKQYFFFYICCKFRGGRGGGRGGLVLQGVFLRSLPHFIVIAIVRVPEVVRVPRLAATPCGTRGWSVTTHEFMFPQSLFMAQKGAEVYGTLDTEWISRVSGMQKLSDLRKNFLRSWVGVWGARGPSTFTSFYCTYTYVCMYECAFPDNANPASLYLQ